MVSLGEILNNIDVQSEYAVVFYDSDDDERYTLSSGFEGHKIGEFVDCEVQYIYYDRVDGRNCIVFELREEDVRDVIDTNPEWHR